MSNRGARRRDAEYPREPGGVAPGDARADRARAHDAQRVGALVRTMFVLTPSLHPPSNSKSSQGLSFENTHGYDMDGTRPLGGTRLWSLPTIPYVS